MTEQGFVTADFSDKDVRKKVRVNLFNTARFVKHHHEVSKPTPDCQLFLDDSLIPDFRISPYAYDLISLSLDNLVALSNMTEHTGEIPMNAGYPIIRAALESSSISFCMLNESTSLGRASYRLSLAVEDLKRELECIDHLVAHVSPDEYVEMKLEDGRLENRRRETLIKSLKSDLGVPKVGRTDTTALVERAGNQASTYGPKDSYLPTYFWQVLSGASHAKEWGINQSMILQKVAHKDGLLIRTRSSNDQLITQSLLYATDLTVKSFRLYRNLTGQALPAGLV